MCANELTQNAPNEWLDKCNMDAIANKFVKSSLDPITYLSMSMLYIMAVKPEMVTQSVKFQVKLSSLKWPLEVIFLAFLVALLFQCLSWLDRRWTNSKPLPSDHGQLSAWFRDTLFERTLPYIDGDRWKNETVIITGGSRGLGAILARKLADRGANVVSIDIVRASFKHPRITAFNCDISKPLNVESIGRHVMNRLGAPTILINNAGVVHGHPLLELSSASIAQYVTVML